MAHGPSVWVAAVLLAHLMEVAPDDGGVVVGGVGVTVGVLVGVGVAGDLTVMGLLAATLVYPSAKR